ncbi:HlyD family efflux transporter periplasmic adaptor subunit [Thiomicrospira microaerophila]|uniref:efflux RND transporter periplasmic adaptor subunit n=1 Tax=Thiomicrospira microaerophila TaxID=406020 RepID=UPI00200E2735|nr:HlyD family efflux transporter periplasmic adaptor subunit [Thiomicrospira microaerophila]UQB42460.1 HlyD family efflux transporter periplasmic adaptor subunit [Thiomicrospira microaerophila]
MLLKSRFFKVLLPLLIVFFALAVFQYLKKTKPQTPPTEISERAWSVEVMTLNAADWQPEITLFGTVQSNQVLTFQAPVSGEITFFPFKAGQVFKSGDRLFSFGKDELDLTLIQAQAELNEAQALLAVEEQLQKTERQRLSKERELLAIRQADFLRNQELYQRNLTSQSNLDQTQDALLRQELVVVNSQLVVDQQQAKLAQLHARLERAQVNLQRAILSVDRANPLAGFSGRVLATHVTQGDLVTQNTRLLEVYALSSLELKASLPARYRQAIEQLLLQGETLKAHVEQFGQVYELTLERLAGQATAAGIEGFFAVPDGLVARPGDLWSVSLKLPVLSSVYAIPYSALVANKQVYLVEDNRLVHREAEWVGEVSYQGRKWALVEASFEPGAQLSVTRLPNAISGLLVDPQPFDVLRSPL